MKSSFEIIEETLNNIRERRDSVKSCIIASDEGLPLFWSKGDFDPEVHASLCPDLANALSTAVKNLFSENCDEAVIKTHEESIILFKISGSLYLMVTARESKTGSLMNFLRYYLKKIKKECEKLKILKKGI